jgi:hypothetical protein
MASFRNLSPKGLQAIQITQNKDHRILLCRDESSCNLLGSNKLLRVKLGPWLAVRESARFKSADFRGSSNKILVATVYFEVLYWLAASLPVRYTVEPSMATVETERVPSLNPILLLVVPSPILVSSVSRTQRSYLSRFVVTMTNVPVPRQHRL